jgi:putative tryptophan/tyrosine transport system substrate-binding protein
MKRREFLTLLGGAAAWPLTALGQQRPVVGYLSPRTQGEETRFLDAFHSGLRQTGFADGGNISVEYRWGNSNNARLPELAADLVRRNVAVIVTSGLPATRAAKAATDTIPIVFGTGVDPVAFGLVASLGRPGGNLTGVTFLDDEVAPKRLELMHVLLPTATDFALLVDPTNPNNEPQSNDMREAARTLGFTVHILPAKAEEDFARVFESAIRLGAAGLIIGPNTFSTSAAANQQLALLAARHAIPTISFTPEFTSAGGLMSYGPPDEAETSRVIGVYTGRILKGEKPANLPVQQATRIELVVNLKTARLFGLTVPLTLLGRADKLIE